MTGPAVGSIFAGCRIEAIAGRGGMGVVYKAIQVALDRPVALKAIAPDVAQDPSFQERFKHEARLAASIDHPNIVPVYEAGEIDGQLYLVMRWVDGVDLRALLDRERMLAPERAAKIAAQVASALGAAHAKGLLHRDIKPANVMVSIVDDAEHTYLTDFGIAKLEHSVTGLTRTGMMVGTIDYMPPERIEGGKGDGRSDIYSLGCALYEMLTGEPPYVRENEGARMYAHLSAEPPSATDARPEVSPVLADVVRRAMAKRPDDRFGTAGEMARALMASVITEPRAQPLAAPTVAAQTVPAETTPAPVAAETGPEPAAPPRPPTAATVSGTRRRWPLAALAAGAIAAVAVGAVVLTSGGGDDTTTTESSAPAGGDEPVPPSNAPAGVAIAVRGNPDGLGSGAGTIWVTGAVAGVISRIDAQSGQKVGEPIPTGADPDTIAVGDDAVWVTNKASDSVTRIDPESGEVVAEILVGHTPEGISLDDDGAPWVALIDDDGVKRIDPETNTPGPLVKTGDEPYALLVDGGTLWTTNRADGTVAHFDLPDGPVSRTNVGGIPRALAAEGSSLYVADFEDRLIELDRESGAKRDEFALKGEPREMTISDGALWVTLHRTNELGRFDLSSQRVTTRPAKGGVVGITAHAGRIWVGAHDASTVTPFEP